MNQNDLAAGIANTITEGEGPTKALLALVNIDALNQLYDWLDEYLVAVNDEKDDGEEEDEEEEDADAEE